MASLPSYEYANSSIPTSKSTVVNIKADTKRLLRKVTYVNGSANIIVVQLWIDLLGTNEVHFVIDKQIAPKEIWSVVDLEGHVMEQNGTIAVSASDTDMALTISSIRIT